MPADGRAVQWPGAGPRMQPVKGVRCAHVGRQANRGVSGAWTVVGSDRATCVVKFNTPRDHAALDELACACIAERPGPPSFEPALLDLDDRQAAEISKGRAGAGFSKIAAWVHFGARPVKPPCAIGTLEKAVGVSAEDACLSDSDQIPGVPGFDTLAQNNDRYCSNACIAEGSVAATCSSSIFDHSHAFGGPGWPPRSLPHIHSALVDTDRDDLKAAVRGLVGNGGGL